MDKIELDGFIAALSTLNGKKPQDKTQGRKIKSLRKHKPKTRQTKKRRK